MRNCLFALSLLAVLFYSGFSSAFALDCSKVSNRQELRICSDAITAASDSEMGAAFKQYRASLVGEARRAALDDQRIWLSDRNSTCANKRKFPDAAADAEVRCINELNRTRANVLLGRPEAGTGLVRVPTPIFMRQAGGRHKFKVNIRVYRFNMPQTGGELYVNEKADLVIKEVPKYEEEFGDGDMSYETEWLLSYGSSKLLSISSDHFESSGGARGSFDRRGINIDLARGRPLDLKNIFNAASMKRISQVCFDQVNKNDADDPDAYPYHPGYDQDDPAYADLLKSIEKEVNDPNRWVFDVTGAKISLGYLLTYASGYYDCKIPFATLDSLAIGLYR